MRIAALLGCAALTVACTAKESAPPADTTAAVPAGPPPVALAHLAGIWNVTARPEGKDSVATTYILNNTDTTDWTFQFPRQTAEFDAGSYDLAPARERETVAA